MPGPTRKVKKKGRSVVRSNTGAPIVLPRTPKEHAFCRAWLNHYDIHRAYQEAGYADSVSNGAAGKRVFDRLRSYLEQQLELKQKVVSKELALDQKDILSEMAAIGFANAQDYVAIVEESVKDENTGEVRMVKRERQKPMMELTRAQASAISNVTFHPDGRVTYQLPDERSKHPYLKDLGQHLGLFHPKLIQEHRHQHMHAAISFRDMDTSKLAQAESMLLEAMGPEGRRMLGILDAEFEEVSE